MFLFSGDVKEKLISFDGSAQGYARLHSTIPEPTGGWWIRIRLARIKELVLKECESVAMEFVLAHPRNDINRASGRSAELCRKSVIYDLKLADNLRRKCHPRRAGSIVCVIQSIDRDRVAARTHTAESKSA